MSLIEPVKVWVVTLLLSSEPDDTEVCGVFASEQAAMAYEQASDARIHARWGGRRGRGHDLHELDLTETVDDAIALERHQAEEIAADQDAYEARVALRRQGG